MRRDQSFRLVVAALALVCSHGSRLPADDLEQFLQKISSDDKEVRYEARLSAGPHGAPAVAPLVKLMADGPREVSISALRALEIVVHYAGDPSRPDAARSVSSALADLLSADASQKIKLELLNLIAFIGGDPVVGAVASMLGDRDPQVSEAARTALERIPGPRAVEALIRGARRASPDRRGDFLFSLGKKGDLSVVPFLIANTSGAEESVRSSAFQALAHLGALDAVAHFERALRDDEAGNRAAVFNEYLRLADNLAVTGQRDVAARIYGQTLTAAPLDHQRERALYQLSRGTGPASIDALITGLSDPAGRVNGLAMLRLSEVKGTEVAPRLRRAYAGARPATRAFLLRALAANDPEGSTDLLEEATRDTDPGVKVTALDIRGDLARPELEADFVELAQRGSPDVRMTAAKGYLQLAQQRLAASRESGSKETTRRASVMFTQALEIAPTTSQKATAIEGIREVGDPGTVDKLEPYLADPVLGSSASDVYMTLALKLADEGDIDRAEPLLVKVLEGQFPRSHKERAADKLREKGRDPQGRVLDQGFVLDWWLIGPLNDDGKGMETKFFPEESVPDEEVHDIGPRRYRWQRPRLLTTDGTIDLGPRFRRTQDRLCYGYTTVVSPAQRDVLFKIGSDDGVACWLNGERIHYNPASRGLTIDEDVIKATLKEGKNVILVKVNNRDGDWQMAFRITDREGSPLRLETANDL